MIVESQSLGSDLAAAIVNLVNAGVQGASSIYQSYTQAEMALQNAKSGVEEAEARLELARLQKEALELMQRKAETKEGKINKISGGIAIGTAAAAGLLTLFLAGK
jgi:hypothetical protein